MYSCYSQDNCRCIYYVRITPTLCYGWEHVDIYAMIHPHIPTRRHTMGQLHRQVFYQRRVCEAPVCWLKYITQPILFVRLLLTLWLIFWWWIFNATQLYTNVFVTVELSFIHFECCRHYWREWPNLSHLLKIAPLW